MANAPDALDDYRKDVARALKIIADRREGYELGKAYYDGTRSEVSASKVIRALIIKQAEAAPISLAHIPVDVIADKVVLASVTAKGARAEAALKTLMEENDVEDESDDWIRKACYFGDYYVIVDPAEEDDAGDVVKTRLAGSSPLSTVVVYDSKDGRTPLYGFKFWQKPDKTWRGLVYYDDATVKLYTPDKSEDLKAETFALDNGGEEGGERLEHDGGRMLISHLPIGDRPYGIPLHTKAYGPQDAITKVSAVNLDNVDAQGFASRWALLDPSAEIDEDIDDDFGDDGPGSQAAGNGDGLTRATGGSARVRTQAGSIALLRGVSKVGQFSNTGSDDFLKNLDWYVRVMAVATGTALFEFDLKGEQPSGESRRRAEGRSLKRARKVQRAAGLFFRDIVDTALAVQGIEAEVTATFNPLETSSDKEGIELVAAKIMAGIPVRVALLEAGYPDEDVEKWYPEGDGAGPHVTPALLESLAKSLAALGQAKTLGVITDEELREMLPDILGAARGEGLTVDDEDIDDEPETESAPVISEGAELKAKADALGILVRAGADPEEAADKVGLGGLSFPNTPTTVRLPADEAAELEGGAPAPKPPTAADPPTPPEAPEVKPPVVLDPVVP